VALAEAVDNFRHATELDPEFALAYVGLADSYALLSVYGGLPREEGFPRAEAAIDKALELDDQLGEAYASLGYLKWQKSRWKWRANDLQGAELALKRSLELSPNYATAHLWYGGLMFSMGRWEDALVETRKAQYLDPLSVIINQEVGWYLEILGRFDEALLLYEKIIEIDPTDPGGYRKLAIWHRNSGKLDEAVIWFRKTVAVDPDSPTFPAYLGQVYLDLGDDREAEYWIRRSLQLGPERLEPNYAMFSLHVYRGDEAEALDLARKALMGDTLLFYPDKHVFQADRYNGALARIEYYRPELLHDDEPNVDRTNYPEAIRIASVLLEIGERKRANQLLDRSLMTIQGVQRLGGYGYGIADVLIYALRGEPNTALTLLRQAFNEGWRKEWWWVERLYILDSIRDEPEFQAIMDEIRSDMAVQLERVRALEASGELEPIPDIN